MKYKMRYGTILHNILINLSLIIYLKNLQKWNGEENLAQSTNQFCQLNIIDLWCNKGIKKIEDIYVSNIYIYNNIDVNYFVVDIKRALVQQYDLFLFLFAES